MICYAVHGHYQSYCIIRSSTGATPPAPPNTIITSATSGNGNPVLNDGSIVSTSITFQISATPATNPVAGFECSLDGAHFLTVLLPIWVQLAITTWQLDSSIHLR